MKKKYLVQSTKASCGAVAIINLFKKMGYRGYGVKQVGLINREIQTDHSEGSKDVHLKNFLRDHSFKVSSANEISLTSLRYLLTFDKDLILTIETPFYCHYATVVGKDENGVFLSNCYSWKDMQKDNQPMTKLQDVVHFSFKDFRAICNKKDHRLDVIIINRF